jgi:hypothetical protein
MKCYESIKCSLSEGYWLVLIGGKHSEWSDQGESDRSEHGDQSDHLTYKFCSSSVVNSCYDLYFSRHP